MNPNSHYCAHKAAPEGSITYYSSLFLEPAFREQALAIYAFHAELENILYRSLEPEVSARTFSWWQEELSKTYHQKQPQHPITQQLLSLHLFDIIPIDLFNGLLQGLYQQIHPQTLVDDKALTHYAHQRLGLRELMLCYLEKKTIDHPMMQMSQDYAISLQLIRNILMLPQDLKRGQNTCAEAWNISINDPQQRTQGLHFYAQKALEHAQSTLKHLPNRHSILALPYLELMLMIATLKKLKANDFKSSIHLWPLKKLWLAYRSFQRLPTSS